MFYDFRHKVCSYVSDLQLHLIQCSHSRKPAWAQNDAMMEAYLDNIDYYYRVCAYFFSKYKSDSLVYSPPVYLNHDFRYFFFYQVNDDSLMKSPAWTETFISALQSFKPPKIGVVGPSQMGGKLNILTYDFVHR